MRRFLIDRPLGRLGCGGHRPRGLAVWPRAPQLPRAIPRVLSQLQHWLATGYNDGHISFPPTENEVRCFTTPMKCSARFLAGASKLAGMGAGWLNNPSNPWGYSSMGPIVAASLEVFAHASAPRGKPEFGLDSTTVGGKRVRGSTRRSSCASRSASSSISRARASKAGPRAADRRADVGPLCDVAARDGRAAAAEATTSTSPTGATRSWCR